MPNYIGKHPSYYDLFYQQKPYPDESKFIQSLVVEFGRPCNSPQLLEVACGTGTHSALLSAYGYQVTGVDSSEGMIEVAKKKAREKNVPCEFFVGDMLEIDIVGKFDVVTCLFDSIGYLKSDDAILKALSNFKRALKPGGCFISEYWHAPTMKGRFDPTRVKRYRAPNGEIVRVAETSLDLEKNLATVAYDIIYLSDEGTYERTREKQTNRFFDVDEYNALLKNAGFEICKSFSGYDANETITEESWHIVNVARVGDKK